jgi:hypothetical protein
MISRKSLSLWVLPLMLGMAGSTLSHAQTGILEVNIGSRGADEGKEKALSAYRNFNKQVNDLTLISRQQKAASARNNKNAPYIFPTTIRVVQHGKPLNTGGIRNRTPDITLDIDPAFGAETIAFLQNVYTTAQPFLDSTFGTAAVSGTVKVVRTEDISDRNAIIGGFYLPNNGSGGREIYLPSYNNRQVTAVNLLHCVLLAYLPDTRYAFDAYYEGLVRAALTKVVRISAAVPTLEQDFVESILGQSYTADPFYEWDNQRSLSGSKFIAPNLLNTPIPQGQTGGIFIKRYNMASSAWQKVLAQYPNFIRDFNTAFKGNTAIFNDATALENLAGSVLGGGVTVEDLPFSEWVRQQFILETTNTVGRKLHVEAIPDYTTFGGYLLTLTYISTDAVGNETLLSGISYPIFWDTNFNRINPSAQDERIDIASSIGTVSPFFPDQNAGNPYRVAIDIPVQDLVTRVYAPAGRGPRTPSDLNLFGSVIGFSAPPLGSLIVRAQIGSTVFPDITVLNGAFGGTFDATNFAPSRSVLIRLVSRTSAGIETVLLTRRVNKGPGALAVNLGESVVSNVGFNGGLLGGIQAIGLSGDPLRSTLAEIITPSGLLAARYNPSNARYEFSPNIDPAQAGQGFFARVSSPISPIYSARTFGNIAMSVALKPGWNLISVPVTTPISISDIFVIKNALFPFSYSDAITPLAGDLDRPILGADIFDFIPGAVDSFSGVNEGGSYAPVQTLQPGKAYFVRCLSADGATLLFTPGSVRGRSVSSAKVTFKMQIGIFGAGGDKTTTFLGQTSGATRNFDPTYDSSLPPSVGGLQVAVINNGAQFTDIRGMTPSESFRVMAFGCKVGKTYTMVLDLVNGNLQRYEIFNLQNRSRRASNSRRTVLTFRASQKDMAFDISVRGAK